MKKGLKVIALVLALSLFALIAMGSGSSSGSGSGSGGTGNISGGGSNNSKDTPKETITEQVLFDKDGITVTAKEYVTDSIWGEGIKLLVENNNDRNVTVSCDAVIVNNFMVNDLFSSSVAAGKKANETLYLLSSELNAAGIETVGQIELYFRVYDSDSWDDLFKTGVVTIKTSEFDNMDTSTVEKGFQLVDQSGVKIYGQYVDENSFWGASVLLYIENNSGKNILVSVDNLSVNGFMMDAFFGTTVYDGKMSLDDITLFASELEENDIDKIEEIELTFRVINNDSWDTIFETSAISFEVN